MNLKLLLSVLISTFLLHGCATTSSTNTSKAELYNQELIKFSLPKGWVQVYRTKQGNMVMTEAVPKGQTVDDWKEMVTMQLFVGGLKITTKQFADSMKAGWVKACPGGSAYPGRNGKENGYEFAFWLQSCGLNPKTKKPEITLVKAIEGNDSFYVVQKAWKYMPAKKEVTNWSRFMRAVVICDSRIPDRKCQL